MKYLVCPELDKLTRSLTKCDLGDAVLNGKVEAYSCKKAGEDKRVAKTLHKQFEQRLSSSSPKDPPSSPLGPISNPSTRQLLISLITTMNASFPDYDFSSLTPEQFKECKGAESVKELLDGYFVVALDRIKKGFRTEFYKILADVIDLQNCQIYTYVGGLPDSGKLWDINYFFYNKKLKKIVFFTVSAVSKLQLRAAAQAAAADEDEDEEMDEMDMEEDDEEDVELPSNAFVESGLLDMEEMGVDFDMASPTWSKSQPIASQAVERGASIERGSIEKGVIGSPFSAARSDRSLSSPGSASASLSSPSNISSPPNFSPSPSRSEPLRSEPRLIYSSSSESQRHRSPDPSRSIFGATRSLSIEISRSR